MLLLYVYTEKYTHTRSKRMHKFKIKQSLPNLGKLCEEFFTEEQKDTFGKFLKKNNQKFGNTQGAPPKHVCTV